MWALALGVVLGSGVARAQIETAQSGNWSSGATWVGGVVPTSGEVVILNTHTVALTAVNQIPAAVDLTVDGVLDLANRNTALSVLRGSGMVRQASTGSITLTLGSEASSTFGGTITRTAGTLSVTKIGTGTNTLTGVNSYNGTTTVNAGELSVSGANIFTGALTVNAGTLKVTGSGTIGSGALFLAGGATVDLSERVGVLTLGDTQAVTIRGHGATVALITGGGSGLTLGATAHLHLDAYDGETVPLAVSGGGNLTLQSGNTVALTVYGAPLSATDYLLITNGVAGDLPGSCVIQGTGRAAGTTAEWVMEDGDLTLRLAPYTPTHDPADIVTQSPGGDWYDAATWLGGVIPGPGDRVAITHDVTLPCGTHALESATVSPGAVLTFETWNAVLNAVDVTNNGTMTHPVQNATAPDPVSGEWVPDNRVWIVCSNLTVGATGVIHGDARGYAGVMSGAGLGPGGALVSGNRGSGAGHGGRGGQGYTSVVSAAGPAYGDPVYPLLPGSSGSYGGAGGALPSGNGGGAILIDASGRVTINGRVSADGQKGNPYKGSGSGGSVLIQCQTLQGDGTLRADGPDASTSGGGEGGGGRIAVHYDATAQALLPIPVLKLSVKAGKHAVFDSVSEFGTIYLTDTRLLTAAVTDIRGWLYVPGFTSWSLDSLALTNSYLGIMADGFELSVTGDVGGSGNRLLAFRSNVTVTVGGNLDSDLVLENGSTLTVAGDLRLPTASLPNYQSRMEGTDLLVGGDLDLEYIWQFAGAATNGLIDYGALITVSNAMTVASGATFYLTSHPTNGGSALIRAGSFTLAQGATINADTRGFGGTSTVSYGPGRGSGGGYRGGGGGYGGRGGYGSSGGNPYNAGGVSNGLPFAPLLPGSAGGYGNGVVSSFGGGLVRIEADEVQIDGTITANGERKDYPGSGAGGGIFIKTRIYSGGPDAVLQANGGSYGSQGGGVGGGGRIAVWRGKVDAAVTAKILAGLQDELSTRLVVTDGFPTYLGTAEAIKGLNDPWDKTAHEGHDGTVIFLTVLPPPGTLLLLR